MTTFQTLVILTDGLQVHPREVTINGKTYEVVTSADGHIPAQCDVLQELVDMVAHGNTDHEELQNQAILATQLAKEAKVGGYGE
jgi:hypothetical protein